MIMYNDEEREVFFMKKHLGLLGVTLLSAAVFAHAKPVQAVAGPTWMEPDDMFLKKVI